jgi:hypothetical protein
MGTGASIPGVRKSPTDPNILGGFMTIYLSARR